MPKEILTRCGLRCDLCLAYKDNIAKDNRTGILSGGWQKYLGFRVEPEDIYCDGCLSGDCVTAKLLDTDCPIRGCVISKGIENCSQCDEFICDKFKQRSVDYEEIKSRCGKIPRSDYKLFIEPYENKKRIESIRAQRGSNSRMYNKELKPDLDAMTAFVGSEYNTYWLRLLSYIDQNYKVLKDVIYYGKNYGWVLRVRRNKSKTFVSLLPERKAFTFLIIMGDNEIAKAESQKELLSNQTYQQIIDTPQLHDGKWFWLRVDNDQKYNDALQLIKTKI